MKTTLKRNYREQIFVREYLKDLNGTQAAIRAGYAENSAGVTASRLLKKANVRAMIEDEAQALMETLQIENGLVLREIAKLAYSNIKNYVEIGKDGEVIFKDLDKNPEAIESISTKETTTTTKAGDKIMTVDKKIKLWDKPGSLRDLGRYLKLFTDLVEHSGEIERPFHPTLTVTIAPPPPES